MTIEYLLLALRLIIIAVLLVSGFAKLADREGSAEAMNGFGVPRRLVPFAAFSLPFVEIALAIGLVFAATVSWAAMLTTLLFLAFTIGVGRIVLSGENLDCHCFGQLSTGPVSRLTLIRNIALTLAGVFVAWWAWTRDATAIWEDVSWAMVGIVVVLLAFVVRGVVIFRLWQTQAALLGQIDELQAMIPAGRIRKPPVEESFVRVTGGLTVTNTEGESVPVSAVIRPKSPAMLIFVSSSCRACNAIMPDIANWQQEFAALMPISVIGTGDAAEVRSRAAAAGIDAVYMREGDALATTLNVNGNPTAVLVDHDGFVRAKPMLGGVAIRRAVEELRRQAVS